MDQLLAISYRSKASRDLSPQELDAILTSARAFNADCGVTGVLFYSLGEFMQYIEGSHAAINQVYQRILDAGAHHDVVQLYMGEIASRQFDTWHMGFCQVPESALQEIYNAQWHAAMPVTRSTAAPVPGINPVVYFWNKWSVDGFHFPAQSPSLGTP